MAHTNVKVSFVTMCAHVGARSDFSMKDKRHQMKAGHRAGDSLNSGRHSA